MPLYYVSGLPQQEDKLEFLPMKFNRDVNHNSSPFTQHRKLYPAPGPLPNDILHSPAQTKMFSYKGQRKLCTKYRLLLLCLVIFILLSVIMASLFIWQVHMNSRQSQTAPQFIKSKKASATGCLSLPEPVPLVDLSQYLSYSLKKMEEFIKSNLNKDFGALSANLVYRDDIIWSGSFGVMNKSEKVPRKPKTSSLYPCASVSKAFTALIVYKLLDEGKIATLDEQVNKFDPDFKIKNPFNNHQITLRNLLAMDSGISREAPCYLSKGSNLCPYSHSTMIKRIQNASLLVEPNTIMQYSNFGYSVLGNVLAKKFTGGDYNALAKQYVFDPLGIQNTMLSISSSQLKDVPVAYFYNGKPSPVYNWGWLNPAGGFSTSVEDLAKMVIALMSDDDKGRYLSKYITRELLSVANVMSDGVTMSGTPWEMELIDGIVHRRKGGSVFGYEALVAMVPELRIALNIQCSNCETFISIILKSYFVEEIVPSLKQILVDKQTEKVVSPPNYEAYLGNYKTDDVPTIKTCSIIKQDNKLTFVINNIPLFYMNYTGPRTFRFINTRKRDCFSVYIIANENDPVLFDEISTSDKLHHGFTLYGASPTGKSHFYRVPST